MNNTPNLPGSDADDRVLHASAVSAAMSHHAGVSPTETSAALATVRARAAAGDTGSIGTTTPMRRPTSSRWRPLAMAAAVAALFGGGAVAISMRDSDSPTVVPATDVTTPSTIATTEPITTEPTTTEPAPTTIAPTTTPPGDPSLAQPNIPYECVGENACTQLIGTADGRIVAYSPVDETITVYDTTGTQAQPSVTLTTPLADSYPFLVAVGPDDVVYVNIATPGASDPISDLIAIPLTGPGAGMVVQRWTGLDGSGDSALVPQADAIVTVGCCGPMETRPAAEAERYPYVDSAGATITSTATTFRLDLSPGAGSLVRIDNGVENVFPLPTEFQAPRDFPRVVATADGGALALDWVDMLDGGAMYVARFSPPAAGPSQQQVQVYRLDTNQVALLEPSGAVLIVDGDHFTRVNPADIGTRTNG